MLRLKPGRNPPLISIFSMNHMIEHLPVKHLPFRGVWTWRERYPTNGARMRADNRGRQADSLVVPVRPYQ